MFFHQGLIIRNTSRVAVTILSTWSFKYYSSISIFNDVFPFIHLTFHSFCCFYCFKTHFSLQTFSLHHTLLPYNTNPFLLLSNCSPQSMSQMCSPMFRVSKTTHSNTAAKWAHYHYRQLQAILYPFSYPKTHISFTWSIQKFFHHFPLFPTMSFNTL